MQSLRYTGASFYEKVRTFNQQYKTDYKEYKNKGKRGIVNKFLHVFLLCVIHYSVVSRKLCDDKYPTEIKKTHVYQLSASVYYTQTVNRYT